jgi:nitrate/nitrite transporter NarK
MKGSTMRIGIWVVVTLVLLIGGSMLRANLSPQLESDVAIHQMEQSDTASSVLRTHNSSRDWFYGIAFGSWVLFSVIMLGPVLAKTVKDFQPKEERN